MANIGGAVFNSSSDYYDGSPVSAQQITGDMAFAVTLTPSALPASDSTSWAFMQGADGETSDTNILYGVGIRNNSGTSYWSYFHESGAGANHRVDSTVQVIGAGTQQTVVCLRDTTTKTVRFIVDGVDEGAFSYSTNPLDGSSTHMRVGKSWTAGQEWKGVISNLVVWSDILSVTDAQKYDNTITNDLIGGDQTINDISNSTLVSHYPITGSGTEIDLQGAVNLALQGSPTTVDFTNSFTSPDIATTRQGYTTNGTSHFLSDTVELTERDGSWTLLQTNSSPFTGLSGSPSHIGDICTDGTYLYAGISDYPSTTSNHLVKYLTSDLSTDSGVSLGSTRGTSAVAIDTVNSKLYASSFVADTIDIYDADLTYESTINITPSHDAIQGLTYRHGYLYAMTHSSFLLIIDPLDGQIIHRHIMQGSYTEREGIDYSQNTLRHLIRETATVDKVHYYSDVPLAPSLASPPAAYDITAQETITATIPASAVTGASSIVASPDFTIDAVSSATLLTPLSETDLLSGVTSDKEIALGSLSEVSALSSISASSPVALGSLSEIDSLPSVVQSKSATVSSISELDSITALGSSKVEVLSSLSEINSLSSITESNVTLLGSILELNSLSSVSHVKVELLSSISEFDNLSSITESNAILLGSITELNSLNSVDHSKLITTGSLSEFDSLNTVTDSTVTLLGRLSESNSISPLTSFKDLVLNSLSEVDSLNTVVDSTATLLGSLSEISSLSALTSSKVITSGSLIEVDSFGSLSVSKSVSVNGISELDSLESVTSSKLIPLSYVSEFDSLSNLVISDYDVVGSLAEVNSLGSLSSSKAHSLNSLGEIDSVSAISSGVFSSLGAISENNSLSPLSLYKQYSVGGFSETNYAEVITWDKTVSLSSIGEVDSLTGLISNLTYHEKQFFRLGVTVKSLHSLGISSVHSIDLQG